MGLVSPFDKGETHVQPSGQVRSKLPHGKKTNKQTKFLQLHQPLSHVFTSIMNVSISIPITEGIEENFGIATKYATYITFSLSL